MDPFDDLLRGVCGDGAVFGRSVLSPPWALRFSDGASLTLCVPLRGEGWVAHPESDKPRLVGVGETVIVRGPEPFIFAAEPRSSFRPEEHQDVRFDDSRMAGPPDVDPADRMVLLAGAYRVQGRVSRRLLDVLPPLLVVPDSEDCASLRDYLGFQLAGCRPGRQIKRVRRCLWSPSAADHFDLGV
jgi:hypothetical protein